jgi:hypothetical protein
MEQEAGRSNRPYFCFEWLRVACEPTAGSCSEAHNTQPSSEQTATGTVVQKVTVSQLIHSPHFTKTQTFVLVPKIVNVTQFKIVPTLALHLFKIQFNITLPTNIAAE